MQKVNGKVSVAVGLMRLFFSRRAQNPDQGDPLVFALRDQDPTQTREGVYHNMSEYATTAAEKISIKILMFDTILQNYLNILLHFMSIIIACL